MITGIYKITSPDGKIYIGQGENTKRRMRRYHTEAIKQHPRLNESALIHGIENFTFEVIHECLPEELNYWERYYQDQFDVCGVNGLNSKLTATSDKKGEWLQEVKDRISKSNPKPNLGLNIAIDTRNKVSISKLGNQNMVGFTHSNETKDKCKTSNDFKTKRVQCIETGEIFPTVKECSVKLGVHRSAVQQSIRIKCRCKGLTFRFIDDKDKIGSYETKLVFNTETGIFYDSLVEAGKTTTYRRCWLSKMLNGRVKNNTSLIYA